MCHSKGSGVVGFTGYSCLSALEFIRLDQNFSGSRERNGCQAEG